MTRGRNPNDDLLTSAVNAVFGPGRPAAAAAVIVMAGLVGWCAGVRQDGMNANSQEWLRPWACAGYGIAFGGVLTLGPRVLRIAKLRAELLRRPAVEAPSSIDRPWWPLCLLPGALRHTPLLRMTVQDFTSATTTLANEVRALLAQRLWPACVAAFTAPVLGLVSAWWAWGHAMSAVEREATVAAVPLLMVASPMVFTILAGLAVMLAAVVVDQMTRGLLQRWSATLLVEDAMAPVVRARLEATDGPPVSEEEAGAGAVVVEPSPPVEAPRHVERAVAPAPTAGDLSELGRLFQDP
jgi:hypothetical protein